MTTKARSKNSFISHNLYRSFENRAVCFDNSLTVCKATHVPAALKEEWCEINRIKISVLILRVSASTEQKVPYVENVYDDCTKRSAAIRKRHRFDAAGASATSLLGSNQEPNRMLRIAASAS